ncbi:MAG TPA: pyridoxamine 5'-phosphate oxidase family protein, partial [Acidobacteriota bacterium]|nr:pyridoxamine 5'-phosphate oxidase family protein [Acidobacteriota bacterium]
MTRAIAPEVPESVIREIRRRPPPSSVIPLVSLDSEGFPHVALLSFFETVYCEPRLYFFIRAKSGTAENLKTRPQCALIFAEVDFLFYLKGRASLKATIADQAVFQFCL